MKVKCVRLLNSDGKEIEDSPWLMLGRIYHVMSIFIYPNGMRSYGIISHERENEWPSMGNHQAECFEIVSTVSPSNWRVWVHENSTIGISPLAWQTPGFDEAFYDHDPETYPVFDRERMIILAEDP